MKVMKKCIKKFLKSKNIPLEEVKSFAEKNGYNMNKLNKLFKCLDKNGKGKCAREGCSYTAHTKQGHGFCCGCCRDMSKVAHGGCCERVEFKLVVKKETSIDCQSTQSTDMGSVIDLNNKKDETVELGQCAREGCDFVQHKNKQGFCCHKCKNKGQGKHGNGCERKISEQATPKQSEQVSTPEPIQEKKVEAEVVRSTCARAGCNFLQHSKQKHGYCCGRCNNKGDGHGGSCEQDNAVEKVIEEKETLLKAVPEKSSEMEIYLLALKLHKDLNLGAFNDCIASVRANNLNEIACIAELYKAK